MASSSLWFEGGGGMRLVHQGQAWWWEFHEAIEDEAVAVHTDVDPEVKNRAEPGEGTPFQSLNPINLVKAL